MENTSVQLFIYYSHRDEALKQQLDKHLASLKRQKVIDYWHDRKLEAGMEWANKINENLNQSDIILLLISPDLFTQITALKLKWNRQLNSMMLVRQ